MRFFLSVVDVFAEIFQALAPRKAGDELTLGHKIMVALALVFGLVVIALFSLFGLIRAS